MSEVLICVCCNSELKVCLSCGGSFKDSKKVFCSDVYPVLPDLGFIHFHSICIETARVRVINYE